MDKPSDQVLSKSDQNLMSPRECASKFLKERYSTAAVVDEDEGIVACPTLEEMVQAGLSVEAIFCVFHDIWVYSPDYSKAQALNEILKDVTELLHFLGGDTSKKVIGV